MPLDRPSRRIVIAGASSLLGAELKSLLEESRFAGWDLSLVDEEIAVGTLTEAGGEPSVIQPVEEGTFSRAQLIFFTGSASFTEANLKAARESGGVVIDLSGGSLKSDDVCVTFTPAGAPKDKKIVCGAFRSRYSHGQNACEHRCVWRGSLCDRFLSPGF